MKDKATGNEVPGGRAGRIERRPIRAQSSVVTYGGELGRLLVIVTATALAQVKGWTAYLIDLIRMPLGVLLMFATWRITYAVSGQSSVNGVNASGFLLIGTIGIITWTSSIWASGYAIESERAEGTAAALFLSPASRNAVVLGYGIGSFVWLLPSFLVVTALGFTTGARLHVTNPLAVGVAILALALGSLACGFAFAGLFVLSRRGNLLANFLQSPIWLLAGFIVPRSSLPKWVQPLSNILPVSHAVDALRASSLAGAGLHQTLAPILLALATSAAFGLVGAVGLRRVEDAAKRSGALDLY